MTNGAERTQHEPRRPILRPFRDNFWSGPTMQNLNVSLSEGKQALSEGKQRWVYQDCSNSQYPVLGLASCSRPAGQGPKLLPKLFQNWPRNCPVCDAMTARKGRGGGPPGHPSGAQEKLPQNCPGWPGDLVPGTWGSISGSGRWGRRGSGGAPERYEHMYVYSRLQRTRQLILIPEGWPGRKSSIWGSKLGLSGLQ